MIKQWRTVPGFDEYEVSNFGIVRNYETGKVLRTYDNNGYKMVALYNKGKAKRIGVHRVVAAAFIPNVRNCPQVNHKDGNKGNNSVDNLEWCTPSENQQHRRNVLKSGLRSVLCVENGIVYESIKRAAQQHSSHIPDIVRACKNGSTAAGKHWQYTERE